jgi:thioredoxin-like negative regulator of GroEL
MAGHTLSAYTDEQTYQKVSRMARLEDRSTAQIVNAAIRLYMRLPRSAHDALRRLEASGPEHADAAVWAAGRALLDQQYEAALAQGLGSTQIGETTDEDEIALLARAVELARSGT